jgi:hypothetical protein
VATQVAPNSVWCDDLHPCDPAILVTEVASTESDSRLAYSANVVPISRGNWDGRPGPCSHNGERIGR